MSPLQKEESKVKASRQSMILKLSLSALCLYQLLKQIRMLGWECNYVCLTTGFLCTVSCWLYTNWPLTRKYKDDLSITSLSYSIVFYLSGPCRRTGTGRGCPHPSPCRYTAAGPAHHGEYCRRLILYIIYFCVIRT